MFLSRHYIDCSALHRADLILLCLLAEVKSKGRNGHILPDECMMGKMESFMPWWGQERRELPCRFSFGVVETTPTE